VGTGRGGDLGRIGPRLGERVVADCEVERFSKIGGRQASDCSGEKRDVQRKVRLERSIVDGERRLEAWNDHPGGASQRGRTGKADDFPCCASLPCENSFCLTGSNTGSGVPRGYLEGWDFEWGDLESDSESEKRWHGMW
jgi:hypothetical protein